MGTTSQKLEYLNGTKNSLKSAINNLGGAIDSNTTFRQYANVLNDIYDNLPKVTDTGTNVSLNPTLKGRLGIVPKGNTYQESTTGKNLLPITLTTQTLNGVQITRNSDGSVTLNGTTTANTNFIWFGGSLSLEAGTYYIGLKTINNDMNLYLKNGGNTIIHQPMNVEYDTLTLESAKTYTSLRSYVVSGKTFNNETFYPMITKTLPFTYEPYTNGASPNPDYPQEIQSATGTQKVVVSGKNLIPTNEFTLHRTNERTIQIDFVTPLPVGTYTISWKIVNQSGLTNSTPMGWALYNGSTYLGNLPLLYDGITTTSFTKTTSEQITHLYAYINSGASSDATITIEDLQIEQGTTATPYQPYQSQNYTISLGNIELNKIGDYQDYISKESGNWVLYKKTRKISLNISDMNNSENYPGWKNISIIKEDYPDSQSSLNGLCNITLTNKSPSPIIINTKSTNAIIYLNPNIFALTQTQWKEQYPNLTFKLVYGLQEYEQTPITDTNLISQLNNLYYLQSYSDTTNIDVTGNLPMRITASAIKGA